MAHRERVTLAHYIERATSSKLRSGADYAALLTLADIVNAQANAAVANEVLMQARRRLKNSNAIVQVRFILLLFLSPLFSPHVCLPSSPFGADRLRLCCRCPRFF
jgi:hypothetical protein